MFPPVTFSNAGVQKMQNDAGTKKTLIGMSHPGADNMQFTLNVMHWLSHLLN